MTEEKKGLGSAGKGLVLDFKALSVKQWVGIVVAILLSLLLEIYFSNSCFGFFIVAVLLYMIPHLLGVSSVKVKAVVGVAFIVLAVPVMTTVFSGTLDAVQDNLAGQENDYISDVVYDMEDDTATFTVQPYVVENDGSWEIVFQCYRVQSMTVALNGDMNSLQEIRFDPTTLEHGDSTLGGTVTVDENGVYHAYVGKNPGTLTVTADGANSITVTRMDTGTNIVPDETASNTFAIPNFTGSLMLKIDGTKGQDVTSVFLLVSRDETPPVLTLSDPVFFADRDTGEYTITGTADAGSEILYGENGRTQAAGDGSFAIHDKLEDERETNASLYLRAKDSAGNESVPQLAMITRQTRYAVTVNGSYAAQNSGAGSYAAGSVVTVRAGSRGGYTFNGWTADSSVAFDDANAAETTFTMPDGSVTVTANWSRDGGSPSSGRDDSDPRYAVGIPDKTENGSVSVSPKNASQGDRVTVTVKPDAGYELDSLKVFDKNGKELELTDKGDGKFTFIMPAGKVEVKAAFTEEVKISPFRDVPTDAYYYEAVKWAQKKGITGGIGDGLFGPNQPCTRAQIVTFLWRAAGSPEPEGTAAGMTDVAAGSYYEKAVAWAIENGITTGTADGRFAPDATCTRAQGMTFLFRASKASADGAPAFSDVAADAYYAEAVKWATDNGITNGTTSSTFSPGSGCTRAQIVTFLWRLYAEK